MMAGVLLVHDHDTSRPAPGRTLVSGRRRLTLAVHRGTDRGFRGGSRAGTSGATSGCADAAVSVAETNAAPVPAPAAPRVPVSAAEATASGSRTPSTAARPSG